MEFKLAALLALRTQRRFRPEALEAGIISFAFRSQGIGSLEGEIRLVNGKPVVSGDRLVFGAASVFLSVVPVFQFLW